MSEQEAIELLKQTVYLNEDVRDMAIEALNKQVPKQPIKSVSNDYCTMHYFDCPTCGNSVYHITGLHPLIQIYDHHCTCGQAIDWSEVEDD